MIGKNIIHEPVRGIMARVIKAEAEKVLAKRSAGVKAKPTDRKHNFEVELD